MKLDRIDFALEVETVKEDLQKIHQDLEIARNGVYREEQNGSISLKELSTQYSLLEHCIQDLNHVNCKLIGIQNRLEDQDDYLTDLHYRSIYDFRE